jgi:hypothetical protein
MLRFRLDLTRHDLELAVLIFVIQTVQAIEGRFSTTTSSIRRPV